MTMMTPYLMPPDVGVNVSLRDYQHESVNALRNGLVNGHTRQILCAPTGSGKCHPAGERILMCDGSIRAVETIRPGDKLMGPDSLPRTVQSVSRGHGCIVEVRPVKGESWRCNEDHVLTLVRTGELDDTARRKRNRSGELVNVSVREWRTWSKTQKHLHKLLRVGVEFPESGAMLPIDSYFVGVLLGDGTVSGHMVAVTTVDSEIVDVIHRVAEDFGLQVKVDAYGGRAPTYRIVGGMRGGQPTSILLAARHTGIMGHRAGDKRIPHPYLVASRQQRLSLLAGLMDTDGSLAGGYFDYLTKSPGLARDVLFLARSLGFAAYVSPKHVPDYGVYSRISISGDVSVIPTLIPRKKASPRLQRKNVLRTGFTVHDVGTEDYYGFTLDGDGRYLMSDFTVTHNTEIAIHLTEEALRHGSRVVFIADLTTLVWQTVERFRAAGINAGVYMGSEQQNLRHPVQICSAQTLERRDKWPKADLYIVDEAHAKRVALWKRIEEEGTPTVGLTATPFTDGLGKMYSSVVNARTTNALMRDGWLVPLRVFSAKPIDMRGAPVSAGEWSAKTAESRALPVVGDIVTEWVDHTQRVFGGPVPTLVFSATVPHGEELVRQFAAAGYRFEQLSYKQDASGDERRETIAAFNRREIDGLISCVVLAKGFDAPIAQCLIAARPYRNSLAAHIQQLGRVMRPSPGKDFGLVLDHSSNYDRFAAPTEFFWEHGVSSLDAKSIEHLKAKKDVRDEPNRTCSCGFINPAGTEFCICCGKPRPRRRVKVEIAPGKMSERLPATDLLGGLGIKDPWPAISTLALERNQLHTQAVKFARIQYKELMGKWPTWDRPLEPNQPCPDELRQWVVARLKTYMRKKSYAERRRRE